MMSTSISSRAGYVARSSLLSRKVCVAVRASNDRASFSSESWSNEQAQIPASPKMPSSSSSMPQPPVGDSLGKWLQTPFDLLAFGPRTTAGVLVSMPERLSTLSADVEKLVELVQDPRPLEEKQEVLFKEVEDRLVDCLEKGADVETDVLSNVKMMLPTEAANMLSTFIPEPPTKRNAADDMGSYAQSSEMVASSMSDQPAVMYSGSDVFAEQLVSEITEIKTANSELTSILEQVRSNTDVAMTSVLQLSLRDARDQLQRRLEEVSPASMADPSVAAAVREANILLDEINASFF